VAPAAPEKEEPMDASILDAVVAIMTGLCVAMLAWGGWLSIGYGLQGAQDAQDAQGEGR
jgi:hypothetical protein